MTAGPSARERDAKALIHTEPAANASLRVLHVISGLGVGGAESQLRSVLRHSRHHADVVTLSNPGPVAEWLRDDGVSVRDLGMRRNAQLSALRRLHSIVRDGEYDVVHAHLLWALIYARPVARLAGAPAVVATEHSIGETHIERRKKTAGLRALYGGTELCSDATIAVSDTVRERLEKWGVPGGKITVIPNGVDFSRVAFDAEARERVRSEHGIRPDAFVLGVLGRLDPVKRFDMVIEAAAPLLGDDCKLLITGNGEDYDRLRRAVLDGGVEKHVVFAGERHDVGGVLSALDLLVAPSSHETFGLSVLEALANGLPALYTVCPALDNVPTDRARRVDGTVKAVRSEIETQMSRGPGPREPALEVRERYGIEAVSARIDDLYERVLERSRRARRLPPHHADGWAPPVPAATSGQR
jgi:glycosyltransferase involved in cell wall biosynthesis